MEIYLTILVIAQIKSYNRKDVIALVRFPYMCPLAKCTLSEYFDFRFVGALENILTWYGTTPF